MNDKYDARAGVLSVDVVSLEDQRADSSQHDMASSDVLILVGIDDSCLSGRSRLLIKSFMDKAAVVDCFNCSSQYMGLRRFGEYVPLPKLNTDPGLVGIMKQRLDEMFMGSTLQKHRVAFEVAEDLWTRKSLDDLIFLLFVLVDTFTAFPVKSVQAVTSTDKTTLKEVLTDEHLFRSYLRHMIRKSLLSSQFYSMCSKCGSEMIDCFSDETCREALDCLNKCKGILSVQHVQLSAHTTRCSYLHTLPLNHSGPINLQYIDLSTSQETTRCAPIDALLLTKRKHLKSSRSA